MKKKKIAKTFLSVVLVSAIVLVADVGEVFNHIARTRLRWYGLAVAVFLTTYPAAALRWKRLSSSIGYDLSLGESFRLVAVSYSFNKMFPGNAGDVVRSKVLQRYREVDSHGEVLGIVALERYFTVLALLTVVMASLFFIKLPFPGVKWIILLFTAAAAGLSLGLFLGDDSEKWLLDRIPVGSGFLEDAMDGYRSSSRKDLVLNFACSLYIRTAEAVVFFLFVLSLSSGLNFWEGAFVTSVMSLVSALPISPAGIGPVDATGTGLLVVAGLSYSAALSLVMLQRSVGLVLMALIGVLVFLAEEHLL
ncbi:MAG: YbhN family protein [Candidatus Nanohaloarchaea archaeon]